MIAGRRSPRQPRTAAPDLVSGAASCGPLPGRSIQPKVSARCRRPAVLGAPAAQIHGFDDTGFIQGATVDTTNANCPNTTDPHRFGGTITLNHGQVVVPCNLTIQMPANTFHLGRLR